MAATAWSSQGRVAGSEAWSGGIHAWYREWPAVAPPCRAGGGCVPCLSMKGRRAALGLKVRTGRAVVVAMGGAVDVPAIFAKLRIDVAFTFDEGAVYHVAQGLS